MRPFDSGEGLKLQLSKDMWRVTDGSHQEHRDMVLEAHRCEWSMTEKLCNHSVAMLQVDGTVNVHN